MITLKCWNWTEDVSVVHFPSKCVFKLLSLFNAAMRPAKGLLVRSPTLNWHCLYIIFNFWNIFDSMQKHNLSSRDGSDERECTEVVLPGLGYIWHIFDDQHHYIITRSGIYLVHIFDIFLMIIINIKPPWWQTPSKLSSVQNPTKAQCHLQTLSMRAHPSRFSSTLTSLGNNQMKIWQFCSILDWISLDKIKAIKIRGPDENVLIFLHTKIKVNGLFKVWEHCDEGHVAESDDEVKSSGKVNDFWDHTDNQNQLLQKVLKVCHHIWDLHSILNI